jgi:hypothetical protein
VYGVCGPEGIEYPVEPSCSLNEFNKDVITGMTTKKTIAQKMIVRRKDFFFGGVP